MEKLYNTAIDNEDYDDDEESDADIEEESTDGEDKEWIVTSLHLWGRSKWFVWLITY